ncbi:ABC transporter ATP-binding protein [Sphingomonas sp. AOB5]|uniref:ABC transporter ATP-binding protein n=1 Tax=Sphingomonas sp. AOB5 TaxID=3034017 RepID=UPI0023F8D461|nr:ABC transporter ATP-binding protein [Sphingomonas sp. AOB5]MDF7777306.1 ABC transporter ATP-binding protein [Sphingomonas sp. AOB5]
MAIDRVSKRFGEVQALDSLSLSIPAGGIFGLLGPNGAGKTTLLRIATGLVRADAGAISLFGEPAGPDARRRIGAFIEAPAFYPFLRARELLGILAATSNVHADADALLARVGLSHAAERRIGGYSLGMKQRLAIAAALVGNPELLILDEPTNGLDPEGILEMRHLVRDLADRDGLTVLLSSHLLDEVERVCDRVAILRNGRLAAEGSVAELLGDSERLWLDVRPVETVLAMLGERGVAEEGGVSVRIEREDVPALIAALTTQGVEIFEARWIRRDLESVFLAETGGQS